MTEEKAAEAGFGAAYCDRLRNTDKRGENILIQIIDRNRIAMGKKTDIRAETGKGSDMPADSTAGIAADNAPGSIAPEELVKMRDMEIREADREGLADILEIEIEGNLDDAEKKKEFIRQIGNPYLYRQGEYTVKISFADTEATLTDRLKEYIEHMAAAGL